MDTGSYKDKRKSWNADNNIRHSRKKPDVNTRSGLGRVIQMMYESGYYLFHDRDINNPSPFLVKLEEKDLSGDQLPIEKWNAIASKGGRVEKPDKRTVNNLHAGQYLKEIAYSFAHVRPIQKCYGLSDLAKLKIESRQRPGIYSVRQDDTDHMYRNPCHGDWVALNPSSEKYKMNAFFDATNDAWYVPRYGWVHGFTYYELLESRKGDLWAFIPDIWVSNKRNRLQNKPTKTERTMIRFFEKDGTTAVQTDAKDEREFLDDISLLLIEMMDDKEKKPQLKENLRPILSQIFDICCAYNNYKNNVAKKTLYTAGQLVAIEPFAEVEHEKPGKLVTSNGKN